MKLHLLPLGVALAVCTAAPLAAQTLTTWTNPVNVTASAGTLTKSGGCDGCPDSGAYSSVQLTGDGYADFVPTAGQEFYAGLGRDLTAATATASIDFAFSFYGNAYEIRELGMYKTDGTFAAGDHFRVSIENGVVLYRKNGALLYTSKTAPAYPLVLDTSLLSLSASLSEATVVSATTTSTTSTGSAGGTSTGSTSGTTTTTTTTTTGPVRTAVAPYLAVVDRNTYTKPPLPALGPAGTSIVDPIFQSTILRVTDANTRPGTLNRSYRSPSSPHQNAWSANGSYFYVVSDDGSAIPFAFNATTGTASRISPTTSGSGGMVLNFYIEPQFSYVTDSIIYGSVSGGNLHTIDQYDFSTGAYTRILDLETIVSGLTGTYIGGVASSAGSTERIMAMFGGTSQDHHHYIILFDRTNPSNYQLVDTWASTLNGAPTSSILNFSLHHVAMDRSGRYLMLYPTSADQTGTRKAPQSVAWDTQTGVFTEIPVSSHPYGHDSFGYGVSVNQDCCVTTTYDGVQWQFRHLSTPLVSADVLPVVLQPQEVYVEDHSTWNNARPDALVPYISGIFRYGTQNGAWRALDDEIVAVETDVPGQDPTIWRFAQHRTDVSYDGDPTRVSFWYEPRPNISHDGRWVMFTSNWEKTLGTDPVGDTGAGFRQDVFIVKLDSATSTTTTPPPPTVVPVAIGTTSLPSGRATVAYSTTLQASGGNGTYTWSIAGGALPAGLSLDAASGAITGTPQSAGTSQVTIAVADPTNTSNTTSAGFTIAVGAAPVAIATTSLPGARATTPYNVTLQASGGTGAYAWSVASGSLPAGLSLAASTGVISGTPQTAGTSAFTIALVDPTDTSNTTSAQLTIAVTAPPLAITTTSLPGGRAGSTYAATLQASGGSGSNVWSVASGALPAGVTLDASTGTLSGVPSAAGTFTFTMKVTDAGDASNYATCAYSVSIAPAPVPVAITTTTLPAGRVNLAYTATLSATGGSGTFTWAVTSGALPSGLTLGSTTGTISGTPTVTGTFGITITATDKNDATNSASMAYSLPISSGVKIASPRTLPNATVGVFYSYVVQATNIVGTAKWNLQGGTMPPGMTLNSATGVISGTCTKKGTWYFNVRVADVNSDDTLTLALTVK